MGVGGTLIFKRISSKIRGMFKAGLAILRGEAGFPVQQGRSFPAEVLLAFKILKRQPADVAFTCTAPLFALLP